jgi:hypothetical protein
MGGMGACVQMRTESVDYFRVLVYVFAAFVFRDHEEQSLKLLFL